MSLKCSLKCTDLVEEQDEIQSEGNEQRQEPKVVEVARKVVLEGGGEAVIKDLTTAQAKYKNNNLLPDSMKVTFKNALGNRHTTA